MNLQQHDFSSNNGMQNNPTKSLTALSTIMNDPRVQRCAPENQASDVSVQLSVPRDPRDPRCSMMNTQGLIENKDPRGSRDPRDYSISVDKKNDQNDPCIPGDPRNNSRLIDDAYHKNNDDTLDGAVDPRAMLQKKQFQKESNHIPEFNGFSSVTSPHLEDPRLLAKKNIEDTQRTDGGLPNCNDPRFSLKVVEPVEQSPFSPSLNSNSNCDIEKLGNEIAVETTPLGSNNSQIDQKLENKELLRSMNKDAHSHDPKLKEAKEEELSEEFMKHEAEKQRQNSEEKMEIQDKTKKEEFQQLAQHEVKNQINSELNSNLDVLDVKIPRRSPFQNQPQDSKDEISHDANLHSNRPPPPPPPQLKQNDFNNSSTIYQSCTLPRHLKNQSFTNKNFPRKQTNNHNQRYPQNQFGRSIPPPPPPKLNHNLPPPPLQTLGTSQMNIGSHRGSYNGSSAQQMVNGTTIGVNVHPSSIPHSLVQTSPQKTNILSKNLNQHPPFHNSLPLPPPPPPPLSGIKGPQESIVAPPHQQPFQTPLQGGTSHQIYTNGQHPLVHHTTTHPNHGFNKKTGASFAPPPPTNHGHSAGQAMHIHPPPHLPQQQPPSFTQVKSPSSFGGSYGIPPPPQKHQLVLPPPPPQLKMQQKPPIFHHANDRHHIDAFRISSQQPQAFAPLPQNVNMNVMQLQASVTPHQHQPSSHVHHQQIRQPISPGNLLHQSKNQQHQTQSLPQPKKTESPWTEHTAPSGIKYYYNSVTKESTYSKPADFKSPSNVADAKKSKESSKWKEYTDVKTGKKYYSDGKITSWEKPLGFVSSESISKEQSSSRKRIASPESSTKPKKIKKKSSSDTGGHFPRKEQTYSSKEEAVAAFKGLLLAKGITPSMKWADVFKICSEDYRWLACKTLGERKQALAEYQTKRANEEKELRRQEIKRAKDAFHQLMTDMLPRLGIQPNSRFGENRDKLAKDDRFFAVEDEDTREELFYDFVEEMRKREERLNRAKKKTARDAFLSFLNEKEENGTLTFASSWASFTSSLDESALSDPRFSISTFFTESDRQILFADYVIDLQAAEDEKRRRIRDARLRAEKAQRDAYRSVLRSKAKAGEINIVTRWKNLEEILSKEPAYEPVKEQNHDAPRMIFEDFVDDLKDMYRRDKHFLSRLVGITTAFPAGIVVGKNTDYDDFCDKLLKAADKDHESECRRILNREPVSSVRWFYNELVMRAKNAVAAAYASGSYVDSRRSSSTLSSRMAVLSSKKSSQIESEDEGEIVEDGEVMEAK